MESPSNKKKLSNDKGIQTSLRKYGVRNPMQDPEVFKKSMKSRAKKFITESGSVITYHGYEDVVLRFFLQDTMIVEDEIITQDLPCIFYHNPIIVDESRYYPDFWVKPLNLLVEVKSPFTMCYLPELTFAKQTACKKLGYNHIIFVCTKKLIIELI